MDIRDFVAAQLPPAPARVLEVGCGRGTLARAIAELGYQVVAIDPEAPRGEIFQAVTLEDFEDPGPFDAAVASRSLHHIADLPGALDKVARLLRAGGRLIVYEHAWERLDEPTARWYFERRAQAGHHAADSLESCVAGWEEDHAGLHRSAEMRRELDRRFAERFFAWTPYLHEELGGLVTEREERALIEGGEIQASGFCYVGERTG